MEFYTREILQVNGLGYAARFWEYGRAPPTQFEFILVPASIYLANSSCVTSGLLLQLPFILVWGEKLMQFMAELDARRLGLADFPKLSDEAKSHGALIVAKRFLQRRSLACGATHPPTSPKVMYCSSALAIIWQVLGGGLWRLVMVTTASGDGFPPDCLLRHPPPLLLCGW